MRVTPQGGRQRDEHAYQGRACHVRTGGGSLEIAQLHVAEAGEREEHVHGSSNARWDACVGIANGDLLAVDAIVGRGAATPRSSWATSMPTRD